jgi:hypothetical protein
MKPILLKEKDKKEEEVKEDRIVEFHLYQVTANILELHAKDDKEKEWCVLDIKNGGIRRCHNINFESGIPVDDDGRILLINE